MPDTTPSAYRTRHAKGSAGTIAGAKRMSFLVVGLEPLDVGQMLRENLGSAA